MAVASQATKATLHVMAQLAVCQQAVGVALVPRMRLWELRGPTVELDQVAARLAGVGVAPGHCEPMRCGWWQAASRHRALVLADGPRRAEFAQSLELAVHDSPDVAAEDVTSRHASLILVGPRAGHLASTFAARFAAAIMLVDAIDDYRLLVVPLHRAAGAHHDLLTAGRSHGAIAIDIRAAALYRAAARVLTAQRPTCPLDDRPPQER